MSIVTRQASALRSVNQSAPTSSNRNDPNKADSDLATLEGMIWLNLQTGQLGQREQQQLDFIFRLAQGVRDYLKSGAISGDEAADEADLLWICYAAVILRWSDDAFIPFIPLVPLIPLPSVLERENT